MSVAVCLLNYNSFEDTIECVDSLIAQKGVAFSIIIVDNCSTNNSVLEIEKYLEKKTFYSTVVWSENKIFDINATSNIYLIKSLKNGGFSAGNNIAIQFVQKHLSSDLILLLNNDTVVASNFLFIMNTEFKRIQKYSKKKVALGTMEVNYFTKKKTHSGFQYLNLFCGYVFNIPIIPSFKYICGACIMLDNNAPLLDERYFLYFDDVEYAKTLKQKGYKLYKTELTYYEHKLSASTSKISNLTDVYFQSMWRFFKRNYHFFVPLLYFARYVINIMLKQSKMNYIMKKYY